MAGSASALSLSNLLSPLYCNRAFENARSSSSFEKRLSFTCFSSKKKKLGFMDQILDYIEGPALFHFHLLPFKLFITGIRVVFIDWIRSTPKFIVCLNNIRNALWKPRRAFDQAWFSSLLILIDSEIINRAQTWFIKID